MSRSSRAGWRRRPSHKDEAVQAFLASGKTIAEFAQEYRLSEATLRKWVQEAAEAAAREGSAASQTHPESHDRAEPDRSSADPARVVAWYQTSGKTIGEVAHAFNLPESTVREWLWHASPTDVSSHIRVAERSTESLNEFDAAGFVPEVIESRSGDNCPASALAAENSEGVTLGDATAANAEAAKAVARTESKAPRAKKAQAPAEHQSAEARSRAEAAAEAEAAARAETEAAKAETAAAYAAAVEAVLRAEVTAAEAVAQAKEAAEAGAEARAEAEAAKAETAAAYAAAVEAVLRAEVRAAEAVAGAEAGAREEIAAIHAEAVEAIIRAELSAEERVAAADEAAAEAVRQALAVAADAQAAAAAAVAGSEATVAEAVTRCEAASTEAVARAEACATSAEAEIPQAEARAAAAEALVRDRAVRVDAVGPSEAVVLATAAPAVVAASVKPQALDRSHEQAEAMTKIAEVLARVKPIEIEMWVRATGRSLAVARANVLDQLGVDESQAEIEVISRGPRLLGRVEVRARVRVTQTTRS